MGIPGLWKLINGAIQTRTLTHLSVSEGFDANRRGDRTIHLGLDGSLLLNRAQWAAYHQNGRGINMQAGENLPLQILFWQICRLLSLPIKAVIVFDGPDKPEVKRGRKVKVAPHALMSAYQQLIQDAGFVAHIAPGEAEAELSQLNAQGEIDAIISDDVDTFLFGATHVIRTSNIVRDGDTVSIFTASAIRDHPTTQLTPPRILLIAILSGGDYAAGLEGCGITIAYQLSIRTMLGEDLYAAACNLSHHEILEFLHGWCEKLRHHLIDDPNQILGRWYPTIARNISRDFPSHDVLRHYLHPTTSWSLTGEAPQLGLHHSQITQPSLAALAVWCEKYFSWGSNSHILNRFRENLWGGIWIRSLMKPVDIDSAIKAYVSNSAPNVTPTDGVPAILQIRRASLGPGPHSHGPNTWGYSVQVEPHSFIQATLSCLSPEICNVARSQPRKTMIVWVPVSILKHATPNLVDRFHMARREEMPVQNPSAAIFPTVGLSCLSDVGVDMSSLGSKILGGVRGSSVFNPIVLDSDVDDTLDVTMGGGPMSNPKTRLEFLFSNLDAIML